MLSGLTSLSTSLVQRYGIVGVLLGMTAESTGIPLPSEIIMPLAGFVSGSPGMLALMIAAGIAGNLAGSWIAYGIGHAVGVRQDKPRPWLSGAHWDEAHRWFVRYGKAAVFFGRIVPLVRTYISFPAGAADMPGGPFTAYTVLGSAIWSAALGIAGYLLRSQWQAIGPWFSRYAAFALGLVVVAAILWWWRRGRSAAGA